MSAVLQRPPSVAAARRALGMVVAFFAVLSALAIGAPIAASRVSASPTVPIGPAFDCPPEGLLFQQPSDQLNGGFIQRVNLIGGSFTSQAYGIHINGAGYNLLDDYVYGNVNNRDSNLDGVIDVGPEQVDGLVRVHADGTEEYLGLPVGWPSNRAMRYQIGDISSTGQFVTGTPARLLQVDMDPASPTFFNFVREVDVTPPPNTAANPDWAFLGQQLYQLFNEDADPTDPTNPLGPVHLFRINALAPNPANVQYVDVFGAPLTMNGAPWMGGGLGAIYADRLNNFLYASANGTGNIYRIDVATGQVVLFTSTGTSVGLNDGARCQNAPLNVDFGDAPDGYGTLAGSNGPRHSVVTGLALGATTDFDADGMPTADASGDDATTSDDEDAFGPGPVTMDGTAPAVAVPYTNTTGGPVTVAGWLDLNGNGTFADPGERQFVTVAPGAPVNLVWGAANGSGQNTFARFRIYEGTEADPQPVGAASNGEVEDYPVLLTGSYVVSKTATVASESVQQTGTQITYTINVTNQGSVPLPGSFIDPMSDVLDDATMISNPVASDGSPVGFDGVTISWNGTVPVGGLNVTYTVQINETLNNATLLNWVEGPGCVGPSNAPPCGHRVYSGTYSVAKAANVADGTTVQVGSIIEYTVTVTPVGAGVPASFTDNLTNVLDDATLIAGPTASSGTASYDPGTRVVSWSGVTAGQPITVTYSVQVNSPVGDGLLENGVVGLGCPQGTATPPCSIEHYAGSYTVAKTADPVSTTPVVPGQPVTYTITVDKIGVGAVTGATFTDDLGGVLDDATGPTNVTASIGSANVVGNTIVWTGDFPAGNASATITYTVTVRPPDQLGNAVLVNGVTGANCTPAVAGCSTTHPVQAWTVVKTSDPAPGTQVSPSSPVTYRLTVRNTGSTAVTAATVTDSLAGVLDDAVLTSGPTASAGTASLAAGTITWTGDLLPGSDAVTIDYTVTLDAYADLGDGTLFNAVVAPAAGCADPAVTNPQAPGYDPDCSTYHTTPQLQYQKTSDAATPVRPGDEVTYTITVTNTGTATVPAVLVTDDLAAVLDDATLVGAPTGPGTAPTITGTVLSWTGPVAPGTPAVISYTVRVKSAVELGATPGSDGVLRNVAVIPRTACVDGQPACPPNEDEIDAWTYVKTSDPTEGTVVEPGDQITYTIAITNTGGLALTGKSVVDDMSEVLDDADLTAGPTVRAGGTGSATFSDPDDTIIWTGDLPLGQVVYVDYTVTVRPAYQLSEDAIIANVVTTTTGGECTDPPPCEIEHPTKAWDVLKESDAVDVVPGATVNYTITVTNEGSEAVTGATWSDDLTDVLDDATFDPAGLAATSGTVGYDAATSTITWSGDLAIDQVVEITYAVVVNKPFSGDGHLDNAVFTTDGPCEALDPIPDRCLEQLPGKQLTIVKATDPVDLEYARPGDVVWYTVTITNTGELPYPTPTGDVAAFADDLSGVLDDADGPTPEQITVTGPGTAAFDDQTGILAWTGPLAVDEAAVVRYAVTVHPDITGDATLLNVVASDTPGSLCPEPPVTDPQAPGYDPDCVSDVPEQAYEVAKTSNPADGTVVQPGDRLTYTVTIRSIGEADYPALEVTDDLSAVLDDATLDGAPVASAGTVAIADGTLTWTGALAARQVVTVTYSVIVEPATALGDGHLDNVVTGSENFECVPAVGEDDQCETHHDVAAYTTLKEVVSPEEPKPGDRVTYRITITSVGVAPILGETITDDLSGVLDDATWDNAATYKGSTPATKGTLTFQTPKLSWKGDIAVDDTLVITYTVTLRPKVTGDGWLRNVVASNDCRVVAPTSSPLAFANSAMPAHCRTETPIRSVVFAKSVSPAGPFKPGDVVTYTITARNNGEAALAEVTWSDDLSGVLDDADLNGAPTADRGAVAYSAPLVTWIGPLAVDQVATVTYSVVIRESRGDGSMPNGVVGVGPASNCPSTGAGPECATLALVLPPTPPPSGPEDPGELPRTGGSPIGTVAIASMLLAAGVGLVAVRRRRRSITS